jgi:hypothetical protein
MGASFKTAVVRIPKDMVMELDQRLNLIIKGKSPNEIAETLDMNKYNHLHPQKDGYDAGSDEDED